ncbi:hypothetical protein QIG46_28660, partial [Klebsiella pneumoniae]|nr:hypothetical protein [Klebsiella pneumoniae]
MKLQLASSYCWQVLFTPSSVPQLATTVALRQNLDIPGTGEATKSSSQTKAPFIMAHPFASGVTLSL